MKEVRTRLAPSPTGYLHIGTLRTALFCYIFAKQNNGKFILRIEDTDQTRFVKGATKAIIDGLDWASLTPDESIKVGGEYGPYIQSERLDLYKKYVDQLLKNGHAYYCFCSSERLEKLRNQQIENKEAPGYDAHCRNLSKEEVTQKIASNEKYVIRFKMPTEGVTVCHDLVRGKVEFKNELLRDAILMKSDGYPTYHLAVIIDDYLMKISHVFRSEEWLPSLALHCLLYEAFGWEKPEFAHFPLVLNQDKTKMSKRKGDVSLTSYIKKGYLPAALLNYLALLGWNPGNDQEIFSIDNLIKEFSIDKVQKSGAVFDKEKLDWLNGYYIRQLDQEEFINSCLPYLIEEKVIFKVDTGYQLKNGEIVSVDYVSKSILIEQERLKTFAQILDNIDIYYAWENNYDRELLKFKKMEFKEVIESLNFSIKIINELDDETILDKDKIFNVIANAIKENGYKNGPILWPLRVALSGKKIALVHLNY